VVSRRGYDTVFNTYELLQGVHHPHHYNHVSLLDDGRTGIITGNDGILRIVFPDSLISDAVDAEANDASIGGAMLNVMPNPASSSLRVRVLGATDVASVALVDNLGRVVARHRMREAEVVTIDLADVPTGHYRVVVYEAGGRIVTDKGIVVSR
jgi:hypothetical protein